MVDGREESKVKRERKEQKYGRYNCTKKGTVRACVPFRGRFPR